MKKCDKTIKGLLALGKKSKTITTEQISKFLETTSFDLERLDDIYKACSEAGIRIVDDVKIVNYEEKGEKYTDSVKVYLREIGNIPILSAEDEQNLFRIVKEGDSAESTLAKKKLIESNLKLVISVAKWYTDISNVYFSDIIQEGNIGLMKAVDKFNYKLGFRFSTYATWWIRQEISRNIVNATRTIKIPAYVGVQKTKLNRIEREFLLVFGRKPTIEEMAEQMSMTLQEVKDLIQNTQDNISLYTPLGDDEDSFMLDLIADDKLNFPDKILSEITNVQLVRDALGILDEDSIRILTLRFGLTDGCSHTIDEVAKEFHITKERVRMVESRALKLIKKSFPAKSDDYF